MKPARGGTDTAKSVSPEDVALRRKEATQCAWRRGEVRCLLPGGRGRLAEVRGHEFQDGTVVPERTFCAWHCLMLDTGGRALSTRFAFDEFVEMERTFDRKSNARAPSVWARNTDELWDAVSGTAALRAVDVEPDDPLEALLSRTPAGPKLSSEIASLASAVLRREITGTAAKAAMYERFARTNRPLRDALEEQHNRKPEGPIGQVMRRAFEQARAEAGIRPENPLPEREPIDDEEC